MQQRSNEWIAERLCKITGTRISSIMGGKKAKDTLIAEMVKERATAVEIKSGKSTAMINGTNREPESKDYYDLLTGNSIIEVGLIVHDEYPMFACSPDGLVHGGGIIEMKNPEEKAHLMSIINDYIDKSYYYQMQWNMYVTDRSWCDYFSYCPSLPVNIRHYLKRVQRDDEMIVGMKNKALKFWKELEGVFDRLELSL